MQSAADMSHQAPGDCCRVTCHCHVTCAARTVLRMLRAVPEGTLIFGERRRKSSCGRVRFLRRTYLGCFEALAGTNDPRRVRYLVAASAAGH